MIVWVLIVALGAAFSVGIVLVLRSLRRWELPPPESPEAKEAMARLEERPRGQALRRRR